MSFVKILHWMLTTPRVLLILVVYGEMGIMKEGILVWFSSYIESLGVKQESFLYLILSTGIFLGGILGSIVCGWLSDRYVINFVKQRTKRERKKKKERKRSKYEEGKKERNKQEKTRERRRKKKEKENSVKRKKEKK